MFSQLLLRTICSNIETFCCCCFCCSASIVSFSLCNEIETITFVDGDDAAFDLNLMVFFTILLGFLFGFVWIGRVCLIQLDNFTSKYLCTFYDCVCFVVFGSLLLLSQLRDRFMTIHSFWFLAWDPFNFWLWNSYEFQPKIRILYYRRSGHIKWQ